MLVAWLKAFALTQLLEAPIYYQAQTGEQPREPGPRLALALLPSALTHPVVWFVFPAVLPSWPYLVMVAVAEIFAVTLEAWVLHRMGVSRALMWSLAANATSLGLGLLVRHFTGLV